MKNRIQFTNCSRNATMFVWNFGDGKRSTEENPVHRYRKEGTYNVQLVVLGDGTDVDGDTLIQEVIVERAKQSIEISTSSSSVFIYQSHEN